MHHFSRRPARDQQLLCYLHDIKMRSDTARIAAAAARTDPEAMRDLHDTVMEEGFDERVVFARANPDSAEAAGLIRKLERVLLVKGSKVPFSPLERGTTAAAQIIAQLRHYGLPNTFITVGIDETRSTLIARRWHVRIFIQSLVRPLTLFVMKLAHQPTVHPLFGMAQKRVSSLTFKLVSAHSQGVFLLWVQAWRCGVKKWQKRSSKIRSPLQ